MLSNTLTIQNLSTVHLLPKINPPLHSNPSPPTGVGVACVENQRYTVTVLKSILSGTAKLRVVKPNAAHVVDSCDSRHIIIRTISQIHI